MSECKCPSCGKMVEPIINFSDPEQRNDPPWAECPECHFCTGNRENEKEAFLFFKYLGDCVPTDMKDKTFEEFWKKIVCNPNGSLNIEQVKKELFDYYSMMEEVTKVYFRITGGMISKVNTKSDCVIAEAEEHYAQLYMDID